MGALRANRLAYRYGLAYTHSQCAMTTRSPTTRTPSLFVLRRAGGPAPSPPESLPSERHTLHMSLRRFLDYTGTLRHSQWLGSPRQPGCRSGPASNARGPPAAHTVNEQRPPAALASCMSGWGRQDFREILFEIR